MTVLFSINVQQHKAIGTFYIVFIITFLPIAKSSTCTTYVKGMRGCRQRIAMYKQANQEDIAFILMARSLAFV
jgi:hypothetical protein